MRERVRRAVVVSRDLRLTRRLRDGLLDAGFELDAGSDPRRLDVVVLGLGRAPEPALELCRSLRGAGSPLIVALAEDDDEQTCLLTLAAGADDVITATRSPTEVAARISALLRRRELDAQRAAVIRAGSLNVDLAAHRVTVAGEQVRLTPTEFRLLAFLAQAPPSGVSRSEIVRHLWESDHISRSACLTHVANLRRKLARPGGPQIVAVRGRGYRLDA